MQVLFIYVFCTLIWSHLEKDVRISNIHKSGDHLKPHYPALVLICKNGLPAAFIWLYGNKGKGLGPFKAQQNLVIIWHSNVWDQMTLTMWYSHLRQLKSVNFYLIFLKVLKRVQEIINFTQTTNMPWGYKNQVCIWKCLMCVFLLKCYF